MQRLSDLLETFRVYALCIPCGRMEAVDLPAAIDRLGEQSTAGDLRQRVRCRSCGRRTGEIRVIYVGPRDRPAEFQYRR
jgi:hypothetical protein